jgi:molybdopterin guanine dinucleotide-containing S/N-oxide reductase-like protein
MNTKGERVFTSLVGDFAGGTPVFVHVKDDRIIRIRPIIFEEDEAKPWSIRAGDRVFTPPKRTNPAPYDLSVRRRVYNPKRVQYPLKRVGFQPGGKTNTENRGKGEFVRISWDEALDMVCGELKRIKEVYGNSSILTIASGHGSHGFLNSHGNIQRVLNFWGGYTPMIRNPDSWEGWYWGGEHVWGFDMAMGTPDQVDMLEDVMQNAELLVFWSYDVEQSGFIGGQDKSQWLLWLKELGKKMMFISPDCNYTAATKGDKWIPIRPGTDAAMAASVAYVWITEGWYDKNYVYTHGVGFDKWKDYVLGKDDGVPKTPEWAEGITGVRPYIIRALAKEWASKKTTLAIRFGAACRTPYSTEWARMMIYLQTMQGIGKPGVGICALANSAPIDFKIKIPDKVAARPMINRCARVVPKNPVKQSVYQTLVPQAILNPPIRWYGGRIWGPVEEQFVPFTQPMEGASEIRMIWWDTVSNVANWNNTNKWTEAYRSPRIECGVAQTIFLENDALFADIVLPVCTQLEREDFAYEGHPYVMGRGSDVGNFVAVYMKPCIHPLYESKSDYEICRLVAERLGLEKEYTEGNTVEDWIRGLFNASCLPELIPFEEFKEKGYYVFKFPDDWERNPGLRRFYETGTGLKTPSGKIEFYSERLAQNFPDDHERPPVARYIAEGETHQESLTSARAKKYPLLMESPHPRYRFHSQHDTVTWLWEIRTHKAIIDGVCYEAVWMNPKDAKLRGIEYGDLVKVYNERGAVIFAAHVTERMMPGVVRVPNGANYTPVEIGKLERGGAINTISPLNTLSKNAFGMAVNAFLVEVEKWEGGTR